MQHDCEACERAEGKRNRVQRYGGSAPFPKEAGKGDGRTVYERGDSELCREQCRVLSTGGNRNGACVSILN